MNDQAKPPDPAASIELSDHDRLVAVLFCSLFGLIAFVICYLAGLGHCLVRLKDVKAWMVCEIGFILLVPMALHWRISWWRLKKVFSNNPGKKPEEIESFAWRLKGVNVIAFLLVYWLIRDTGGVYHSPFASYGVTLVVLGFFLLDADPPNDRLKKSLWLGLVGVAFYAVLFSKSQGKLADVYFHGLTEHPHILQTAALATCVFSLVMGGFTSSRGRAKPTEGGSVARTG